MTTLALRERNRLNKARWRENVENKLKEKSRRDTAREQILARAKYHTIEGWKKYTLSSIKYRARKRNMEFDLTLDDLVFPEYCPVLGLKLQIGTGIRGLGNYSCPSVDRIDNNKGYTKDNIRIISNRANILKKDGTLEEFLAIVAYLKGEENNYSCV